MLKNGCKVGGMGCVDRGLMGCGGGGGCTAGGADQTQQSRFVREKWPFVRE